MKHVSSQHRANLQSYLHNLEAHKEMQEKTQCLQMKISYSSKKINKITDTSLTTKTRKDAIISLNTRNNITETAKTRGG